MTRIASVPRFGTTWEFSTHQRLKQKGLQQQNNMTCLSEAKLAQLMNGLTVATALTSYQGRIVVDNGKIHYHIQNGQCHVVPESLKNVPTNCFEGSTALITSLLSHILGQAYVQTQGPDEAKLDGLVQIEANRLKLHREKMFF